MYFSHSVRYAASCLTLAAGGTYSHHEIQPLGQTLALPGNNFQGTLFCMLAKDESVLIVDENNRATGTVPRHEMRAKGLVHRATYILVFNSRGELYIQQRTRTKDIYPGYLDVAAGGVVLAGESYEASARRELAEELGIRDAELRSHFTFFYEDGDNRVWGRVFSCIFDGAITLQEEEVERGFFASPADILALSKKESFTPDGLKVWKRFLREKA